jgi:hypothetical protein
MDAPCHRSDEGQLSGQLTLGARAERSQTKLWAQSEAPGRRQAEEIRRVVTAWKAKAGSGQKLELGDWEEYRLQDFSYERPKVLW